MTATVQLPAGGVELADRIAALNTELLTLASAAQAARETELSNVLHILARGLTDTSAVRQYLALSTPPRRAVVAAPANPTITADELASRLDALRVEIDVLTGAAYALGFDSDPSTASVAQGLHKTLRQFQRDTDKRGHGGLKSRLRQPANSAEKDKP